MDAPRASQRTSPARAHDEARAESGARRPAAPRRRHPASHRSGARTSDRTLLEHVSDAVIVTDMATMVRRWNRAAERIYGIAASDALGARLNDLLVTRYGDATTRDEAFAVLQAEGSWSGEVVQIARHDGRRLDVHASVTLAPTEGGAFEMIAVNRDISQRRRAERRLVASQSNLQTAIDHSEDAILLVGADRTVYAVNVAFRQRLQRMFGVVARVGAPVAELFGPTDVRPRSVLDDLECVFAGGEPLRAEREVVPATGAPYWVDIGFVPVRGEGGEVSGVVVSSRDVTARKRAERFRKDQRDALELIARNAPLPDVLERLVEAIEAQADGLLGSVLLFDEGRLVHASAPHLPGALVEAIDGSQGGLLVAPDGSDARSGEPVEIVDIETDERWRDLRRLARPFGLRACWSLPIRTRDGQVVGTFVVYARDACEPDPERLEQLATVARLAGLAVEHRRFDETLLHRAQHDALTGLPNRAQLAERMRELLATERPDAKLAVVLFDLDNFKIVNDSLGHPSGDALLTRVAQRVGERLRDGDVLARLGGDEFVVLAPLTERDDARRLSERIGAALAAPFEIGGTDLYVSASIGVCVAPDDGVTPDALLRAADTAMYAAKHDGKNRRRFFERPMERRVAERLELGNALKRALELEQFEVWFQPRFELRSGRLLGAEALLRWRHPQRGVLAPGDFLEIAEGNGLIEAVDAWVVAEACRRAATWRRAGLDLALSVNASMSELRSASFSDRIVGALERSDLPPERFEIEITEAVLMREASPVVERLERLRAAAPGLRVAVDDFGSGYSSLAYLHQLPIDTLKIDRGFVAMLAGDVPEPRAWALAKTIVDLGVNLGLRVVAEGIEREVQRRRMADLACHEGQGYLLGGAMAPTVFEAFARRLRAVGRG